MLFVKLHFGMLISYQDNALQNNGNLESHQIIVGASILVDRLVVTGPFTISFCSQDSSPAVRFKETSHSGTWL